jgi:hypothetical protein
MRHKKHRRSSPGASRGRGSVHYQVIAEIKLTHGKPQLISTSLFTTSAPCTALPIFENSVLIQSRIFPTLKSANSFIVSLYGAYPHSPAPPPLSDNGQEYLFKE